MTDNNSHHERYEQWLAKCREVDSPDELADQIMAQIVALDCKRRRSLWLRVVHQIERSRVTRWSVCGGALAIGGLPFFVLAHVTTF